nr:cathepsin G-like [Chrysemys picta bellii]
MQLQILLLLPMAFLLPPGAQAGEIIGGREAKPHSRPYMAYLQRKTCKGEEKCGGFLVREDFVLTAAHCADGDITVLLGAHNVRREEETQQRVSVRRKIPHPRYNKTSIENDLMLLQGDSGGPLVCDEVAHGIVSFGKKNGSPPRVFTRISAYVPWIKKTMRGLSSPGSYAESPASLR